MKRALLLQVFLLLFLGWLAPAMAQDSPWPRKPASSQIEVSGLLPWPTATRMPGHRLALVKRWYWMKLTAEPAKSLAQDPRQKRTAYGGLPQLAYLDYVSHTPGQDEERFRLLYQVALRPTSRGLAYRLSHFEYSYFSVDAGTNAPLEEVLKRQPTGRPEVASFHQRLLSALASW
jgi:hypothetical protein